MRATIHLVSRGDYWPIAVAIREAPAQGVGEVRAAQWRCARRWPPAAKRLRARLREESPLPRAEIHELLGKESVITNGVNMWLDLVRVPPSGTWERRRADLYAAAEDWVGPGGRRRYEDGLELLVRRYLGGFGPGPGRATSRTGPGCIREEIDTGLEPG